MLSCAVYVLHCPCELTGPQAWFLGPTLVSQDGWEKIKNEGIKASFLLDLRTVQVSPPHAGPGRVSGHRTYKINRGGLAEMCQFCRVIAFDECALTRRSVSFFSLSEASIL